MTDLLTNPDAEVAMLVAGKAKTSPPLPTGSLATDAPAAKPAAAPAAAVNPNLQPNIAAAIVSLQTAIKQIAVTGDLSLASSSCSRGIQFLQRAAAAAPAA